MTEYCFSVRVYYEDTDAGGVVYYANYLKYAERARTEMLREAGVSQSVLAEEKGVVFVVRHVDADLQKPARLDDWLDIRTSLVEKRRASFLLEQRIYRDDVLLVVLRVKIAAVSRETFRPVAVPENVVKI